MSHGKILYFRIDSIHSPLLSSALFASRMGSRDARRSHPPSSHFHHPPLTTSSSPVAPRFRPTSSLVPIRISAIAASFCTRSPERGSAIGVLAMTDGMNVQSVVGFFGEANSVIADAEAQFAGLSLERGEDAHGGVTVEPPDISAGAFGPGDFLHA